MPSNMTIKDIAKEAGYSVSTVSRTLNNHPDVSKEAKEAVARVVEQHNFELNSTARLLKQQQSRNILIIVKGTMNLFFVIIVEKMQHLISEHGYNALVHYLDESGDEVRLASQLCRERKPSGLIFLGGSRENFQKNFAHIIAPAVLATTRTDDLDFDNLSIVSIDDVKAGEQAIDYLINRGHRIIGIIGGNPKLSYISQQRFAGCQMSFLSHGISFDPELYQKSTFHFESACQAAKKLLNRQPGLTALFCMSDVMAIGVMRSLADMGFRVPEDVSVIGFDGIELGQYYDPRLTTIAQPQIELAQISVDLLIGNIEKKRKASKVTLAVSLKEGESVREITI